jgi:hypothetical protein
MSRRAGPWFYVAQGSAMKQRMGVWFIWFLWFIRLVWFNQINETNQTNQSNQPVIPLVRHALISHENPLTLYPCRDVR